MFTDEELDRREQTIGFCKHNVDPAPNDETLLRLNELAERTNMALPRIVNMRQSGVRSQGGLEWLRRLFAPETWREREFSRRIKVGTLDDGTKEALDDAIKILRTQISVVELCAHAHHQALNKRVARELEGWWKLLDVADKKLGMKALQNLVDNLEATWAKADLDQRIDLLATAMWAIEEHHRAEHETQTMEVVVASVVAKPASVDVA